MCLNEPGLEVLGYEISVGNLGWKKIVSNLCKCGELIRATSLFFVLYTTFFLLWGKKKGMVTLKELDQTNECVKALVDVLFGPDASEAITV